LQPVIEDAIQACEMKASEKHISLRFRCPEGIEVKINRHMIEQALINLIENAIKYSPEKTSVRVEVYALPQTVRIDVLDQGPGIAPQHHSRLFERFYRVDKARSRRLGGTGLGLAIVKNIVGAHDGQVTLRSAPGEGSQFTIYLPRA
jgi:two-component system phosphate regulon sensor histidine kinase PhoR